MQACSLSLAGAHGDRRMHTLVRRDAACAHSVIVGTHAPCGRTAAHADALDKRSLNELCTASALALILALLAGESCEANTCFVRSSPRARTCIRARAPFRAHAARFGAASFPISIPFRDASFVACAC
eukprot:4369670-Pleurochrysis_carterae.AAC.1